MVGDRRPYVDDLARLRTDAAALAAALTPAPGGDVRFTGTDSTRRIAAVVDAAGKVRDVSVDRRWREGMAPADLPAAVTAAVEAAALARARALDAAVHHRLTQAGPVPHQVAPTGTAWAPASGGTPEQLRAATLELLAMVSTVADGVREVTAQLDAYAARRYTGHGPYRRASVTIDAAGHLMTVHIDRRWLDRARTHQLGYALRLAFAAAYEQAAADSPDLIVARSTLGALAALAGDPAGLARRLGLDQTT